MDNLKELKQIRTALKQQIILLDALIAGEKPEPKPRKLREADMAYEMWAAQFLESRGTPYAETVADFVQLANLKNRLKHPVPHGWDQTIANYLQSPLGRYRLSDLCSRYDIFLSGAVDRYGKPEEKEKSQFSNIWGDK